MTTYHDRAVAAIDGAREALCAASSALHANPEVAFAEHASSRLLCDVLARHGIPAERGVGGLETAFRAPIPGMPGGPTVAFLSEYDALPGIGHACGHNLIGVSAVAAGIGAAAAIPDLRGGAVVIGTPAEEGGGGKVLLLKAGVFSGVDAAMMFHPASYTLVERPSLASFRLRIVYHGRPAHAAAAPDQGINALDALIALFVSIGLLRKQLRDDARVHGIVTDGGAAANIIPERAEGVFTVRAVDDEYARELLDRVVGCAEGAAAATGARLELDTKKGYSAMRTNRPMARRFGEHLAALGRPVDPTPSRFRMGSTDHGDISQVIPAIHPYVAITDDPIAAHTIAFRDAAITPRALDAMITAGKAMALLAIDLLADPAFFADARAAFAEPATARS
jgi:amidohydrolase